MSRNETLRTIQSLQEQDARREASSDAATPRRARRERTATERAGDEGVWIAALFAAFVSFTVPAWFLGVGLSLAKGTELASTSGLQIAQIVTLGLGAIAVGLGVRSAWVLARAPRLASGAHGGMMPKLALACGILALVFLHRLLTADAAGGLDLLALIGAAAPALLLAETSFAIPTITRGRYGASIGTPGGMAWAFAGISVLVVGSAPSLWWLPFVCAIAGAACTGLGAMRVWRHYEGHLAAN
jgi:hypothetical protein